MSLVLAETGDRPLMDPFLEAGFVFTPGAGTELIDDSSSSPISSSKSISSKFCARLPPLVTEFIFMPGPPLGPPNS